MEGTGVSTFFKKKTPRDEKYKAWIRTHDCMIYGCGGKSEAAHMSTGGTSLKASDYETLPLCNNHHMEHHRGEQTFYKTYPYIDKWREIASFNSRYIVKLKEGI